MIITTHNKMFDELLIEVKTVEQLVGIIKNVHYARGYIEQVVNDTFINFNTDDVVLGQYNDDRWQAGAYLLSRPTTNIVQQVFLTPKTTKNLKHKQFKSLMEMLHIGEAKLLDAVLNKNLSDLYPTLSHAFICEALNIADDRITTN
jgi:hypothetical protein